MENNIDNIMKPYFDKKDEMDRSLALFEIQKEEELEILKFKHNEYINYFKENQESEISKYINDVINGDSTFYLNYASMLRKDLEREYAKRLEQAENEFKEKENNLLNEQPDLELTNSFAKIKSSVRKNLLLEQKELNEKLEQYTNEFNKIKQELNNFKYEYNDQQQVINGADWRALYENSNVVINKINKVKNDLNKIDQYLVLTELTKEEQNIIDSLNDLNEIETIVIDEMPVLEENNAVEEFVDIYANSTDINDPVESNAEIVDDNVISDNVYDLAKTIYNDIIKEVETLNTVKINQTGSTIRNEFFIDSKENGEYIRNGVSAISDTVMLENGEYINSEDINTAIQNYKEAEKDKTYTVKSTGKTYKVSDFDIEALNKKMKNCARIVLVNDKKVTRLDLIKKFGKQETDKIMTDIDISELKNVQVPAGVYINRNDLIVSLKNALPKNESKWLKELTEILIKIKQEFDAEPEVDTLSTYIESKNNQKKL